MRSIVAGAALGVLSIAVGCNIAPHRRDANGRVPVDDALPTTTQLVKYLNDNAKRLADGDALRCTNLSIDAKANGQSVGLGGTMMCQKPRNFRLMAKLVGQPAVDIGSNDKEFWYWISKNEPPHLFHCSYEALNRGTVIPFPFQPDMVVAALGLANYDETKKYEMKAYPNYIELIQSGTSPQGQPIQNVTVFNRTETQAPAPQVIAHVLKDAKGNILCKATIRRVQIDRTTKTAWPQEVIFSWPAQKIEMKMQLNGIDVVKMDAQKADRLFTRNNLSYQSYDLATGTLDAGLQRAGATLPPR